MEGVFGRETVDKEGNQRIGGKIRKQRIPIINRSPVEKWMESKTGRKGGRKREAKEKGGKRKHGSSISTSWKLEVKSDVRMRSHFVCKQKAKGNGIGGGCKG